VMQVWTEFTLKKYDGLTQDSPDTGGEFHKLLSGKQLLKILLHCGSHLVILTYLSGSWSILLQFLWCSSWHSAHPWRK